jgi:hypothetical protein
MSESTIPFQGQTSVLDRPATELPEPDSGPEGRSSRTTLLAVLGLAGVLVLGVLAYFLLFTGGEAEPAAPAPSKKVVPQSDAEEPVAESVKAPRLTNKSFGRDPFKALIVESVDTPASSVVPAGTTSTVPSTTGGTQGTTTAPTTTVPSTTTPTASQPHSFKVVDVAPDNSRITVKVDGEFYRNLKAGEVFAKYFKVVLISGPVNSFQYGDDKFNVVGTKKLTIA